LCLQPRNNLSPPNSAYMSIGVVIFPHFEDIDKYIAYVFFNDKIEINNISCRWLSNLMVTIGQELFNKILTIPTYF
jgi:hypothetical protein